MNHLTRWIPSVPTTLVVLASLWAPFVFAQIQEAPATDLPFDVVSAKVERFEKAIRLGPPGRASEYQEALVLVLAVDAEILDSLPPSIEPFLYVGSQELRIYSVRFASSDRQEIEFHVPDPKVLEDGAPMVLTIEHGAPIRQPDRFVDSKTPRFREEWMR